MNFLHNLGSSLEFLHFAKQQLQGMHSLIDAKQIPVGKSTDFFQQATDLERALGDKAYAQSLSRYRGAKKTLIIIASIVLALAVILYASSKFGPTSSMFQAVFGQITSNFVLFSTTASIVAGLLLVGLIGGSFYIRSLEKKLLGKDLSALWAKIMDHWAPDIAAKHNVSGIAPENIAPLVAVQARIHDVDLNLN